MTQDTYDFSGLTTEQEWLILYQGWRIGQTHRDGSMWPQPKPRTVKKLIARRLLRAVETKSGGMTVTEYVSSPDVHLAYCLSCS